MAGAERQPRQRIDSDAEPAMNDPGRYCFDGKAAVVLGGTGALGEAICRLLAAHGLDIAFSYGTNRAKAEALRRDLLAADCQASAAPVDLSNPASIAAFVESAASRHGPLGVAVYAAGPDLGQPFLGQIPLDVWQATVHADIDGFFAFAKAVLPIFKQGGGGSIVAVTTTAVGRYAVRDALSAVPKAAVELIAKAIAKEEGRFGIRANCVAPGMLAAGLGQRMLDTEYAGTAAEIIRRNIPLQRFGDAQDIAEAVLFLCSQASRYVTGQVLAVDGGWQI